jgi:hypothetical protein
MAQSTKMPTYPGRILKKVEKINETIDKTWRKYKIK